MKSEASLRTCQTHTGTNVNQCKNTRKKNKGLIVRKKEKKTRINRKRTKENNAYIISYVDSPVRGV